MSIRDSGSLFDAVREKLSSGAPVGRAELEALWTTSDLVRIGMLGDEIRRRLHGDRVTYVRVADVPADALEVMVPEGVGEVRLPTVVSMDRTVELAHRVVATAAGVPVTAGSLIDLEQLAAPGQLRDVVRRLIDVGVSGIGEAPVDGTRDLRGAVEAVVEAGAFVARFTVQAAAGRELLDALQRVRHLHESTGAVRAVAPLPRRIEATRPTTGYEDAKRIAIARLALDAVPTIQVDWQVYGPKLAQVALLFGADDLDAVPAVDDLAAGRRRSTLEEVRRNVRAASLVPVERDARFAVRDAS